MATHSDLVRYLEQQRQMYGNTLYADLDAAPFDVPMTAMPTLAESISMPNIDQSAPLPTASTQADEWRSTTSIAELDAAIHSCMQCPLGATRTNFVFGSGNPNATLMVVGEAPGADEDAQGLPFVGRAGQLLTKILEAIDFQRDDVYICNILKCRPPNNRKPTAAETDECEPYLTKQIQLVRPRIILALGLTAANTLLKNKLSMSDLRGNVHSYADIPLMVTYHPAALLRNPEWKKHTWEDVKHLRTVHDNLVNTSTS
jgi:uracil-DNA glycosylase family 4